MKTKQVSVDYMSKSIVQATYVSRCVHPHSCKNVEKPKWTLWFYKSMSVLQSKGDFIQYLERNHQQCQFTHGINYLIRPAAFANKRPLGDDQSLKLTWMKFKCLSFTVHANHSSHAVQQTFHAQQ
jgi:hypothetical protein